jgi:diguanylate cyclase (GGDEF)-like protein
MKKTKAQERELLVHKESVKGTTGRLDSALKSYPMESQEEIIRMLEQRIQELEKINTENKERISFFSSQTKKLDEQVFDLYTISQAGKVFIANPEIERLSEILLSVIAEKMGVEKCALLLYNETTTDFELFKHFGFDDDSELRDIKYRRSEGLFWHLVVNGEPFSVVDFEGNLRFPSIFLKDNLHKLLSTLWVPLKTKDKTVGIVTLMRKSSSDSELLFLSLLAAQASVAFETAQLYRKVGDSTKEINRQMHQLSILYDVAKALNFIDDFTKLLALILDQAIEILECQKGSLMLIDEKSEELVVRVVRGIDKVVEEKILNGEILPTRLKKGEGVAGTVIESAEPIILNEIGEDSRFKESKDSRVENILCVPLKVFDECIGVINITNKKYNKKFTEEDLKIMTAIASQAAVTIKNAKLYEMAITDGLTKLYIRRHFIQRFEEELRRSKRYKHDLSLVMIDIDHFKLLNDKYGHQAGDEVLVETARVFRRMVRATDIVGRYGGEEFCIVLSETGMEGAAIISERLRGEVEAMEITYEHFKIKATISLGIATFPIHAESPDQLIRNADMALYAAKNSGRNRLCLAPLPKEEGSEGTKETK